MNPEKHDILCKWIRDNFTPRKTVNRCCTSYGLKHVFEDSEPGFYVTNDEFKAAMLECGYHPSNVYELNWKFRISKKSPAVQILLGRRKNGK